MDKGTTKPLSKRFGGTERAEKARKELNIILSNPEHELYFEKDIEFARRFDVSRHTIKEYDIEVKPDTPPIEKLKKYQRDRKRKRLQIIID